MLNSRNFRKMLRWDNVMQTFLGIATVRIMVIVHEREMLNGLRTKFKWA